MGIRIQDSSAALSVSVKKENMKTYNISITPAQVRMVQRLRKQGLSPNEISSRLRLSLVAVLRALKVNLSKTYGQTDSMGRIELKP